MKSKPNPADYLYAVEYVPKTTDGSRPIPVFVAYFAREKDWIACMPHLKALWCVTPENEKPNEVQTQ